MLQHVEKYYIDVFLVLHIVLCLAVTSSHF